MNIEMHWYRRRGGTRSVRIEWNHPEDGPQRQYVDSSYTDLAEARRMALINAVLRGVAFGGGVAREQPKAVPFRYQLVAWGGVCR